jgi:3-dehydroquinate dehydratase II
MKIIIINGPNLNLLGKREVNIYGTQNFESYFMTLQEQFSHVSLDYFQSNVEGELINALQLADETATGVILNAGAYTHTSLAVGDAVAAMSCPVVEVHISNIYSREDFRHKSYISAHTEGIITGFGLDGYTLALIHLISKQQLQ